MMEFGKSLRTAREAKGISIAQLAEQTRMAPTLVKDLENENFSHIAAPIYGRGFVKLYCEAVGLEPKPLVDEFMEILNGNREPRIKERPSSAPPETAAPEVSEPQPVEEEDEPIPTPPPQQDLFLSDAPIRVNPPPRPANTPSPASPVAESAPVDNDGRTVSRYASSFRLPEYRAISSYWRLGLLALVALALIGLLIYGLRALHQATATAPAPTDEEVAAEVQTKAPAAETPSVPRDQQEIPPLYID